MMARARDLAAIGEALKAGGNKDYEVIEGPKLNHLFKKGHLDGSKRIIDKVCEISIGSCLLRAISCNFVDRLIELEQYDLRSHTKRHEERPIKSCYAKPT